MLVYLEMIRDAKLIRSNKVDRVVKFVRIRLTPCSFNLIVWFDFRLNSIWTFVAAFGYTGSKRTVQLEPQPLEYHHATH